MGEREEGEGVWCVVVCIFREVVAFLVVVVVVVVALVGGEEGMVVVGFSLGKGARGGMLGC